MTAKFNPYKWLAIGLTILLLWVVACGGHKYRQQVDLYQDAVDTLTTWRNKMGQQEASITAITASKAQLFLGMRSKDKSIQALQDLVKSYRGRLMSATIIGGTTSDIGHTTTMVSWDTTGQRNDSILFPTYRTAWVEKWSTGTIVATNDSIMRDIKVRNEYNLTVGWQRPGLFKAPVAKATITNLNPNTITTELQDFTVVAPKRKMGIGLQVGYGINATTWKPSPFIGVGLSYNIIQW